MKIDVDVLALLKKAKENLEEAESLFLKYYIGSLQMLLTLGSWVITVLRIL